MPSFIIIMLNHILKEKEQDWGLYRTAFSLYIAWLWWYWAAINTLEIGVLNPGQLYITIAVWNSRRGTSPNASFNFLKFFSVAFSRGLNLELIK